MYRLIAIDLDGTLLNREGKVSDANRDAIRRALDAGIYVCFATGRNYFESRDVLETVGHYDHAVFVGGAVVMDTREGTTWHRIHMEPTLAAEVCQALEEMGLSPLALQDRTSTGVDYLVGSNPLDPNVATWHDRTGSIVKRVDDLVTADHSHTIRIGTVGTIEVCDAAAKKLDERFAERLYVQRIDLAHFGVEVMEIFDPSVNKWVGIEQVAKKYGISRDEIVAVGDDMNDLHMIREAGLGVAMGNAKEPVKQIADRIIGTNAEDGLAKFIHELVDGL